MLPVFLQELPHDFNLMLRSKSKNYEKVQSSSHLERKCVCFHSGDIGHLLLSEWMCSRKVQQNELWKIETNQTLCFKAELDILQNLQFYLITQLNITSTSDMLLLFNLFFSFIVFPFSQV